MWFLKGSPSSINVEAVIASIDQGYQQTSYRFSVESSKDEEEMFIGIAVPWSPHKPNGSIKFNDLDAFSNLDSEKTATTCLTTDDIVIVNRLRDLKSRDDIELVHVQDLINWYLDDIALMTFRVKCGQKYQLNYSHKIATDSCLFLPARLPVVLANRKLSFDYKIWVKNGLCYDLPLYLKKNSIAPETRALFSESLDLLTFNKWDWSNDIHIHTDNWNSSDDGEP